MKYFGFLIFFLSALFFISVVLKRIIPHFIGCKRMIFYAATEFTPLNFL